MTDCVVVQPISRPGVDMLRRAGLSVFEAPSTALDVLRPHLATARAAITRNEGLTADAIDAAPMLELIAAHGTGTDRIDIAAARARGIRIVSTPGANARAVAEHALMLILACAKCLSEADAAIRRGDWVQRDRLVPAEIEGRTLGLVGWGHVSRLLTKMARGLGLRVLCHSRHASAADLAANGAEYVRDLVELLTSADILSLHGRPDSAPVLGAAELGRLRPHAIVVNTARGALIEEVALADALRAGRLAAAGLDVFEQEPLPPSSALLDCPNLILTPHIAGVTAEARARTSLAVARKVIEGLGLPVPE